MRRQRPKGIRLGVSPIDLSSLPSSERLVQDTQSDTDSGLFASATTTGLAMGDNAHSNPAFASNNNQEAIVSIPTTFLKPDVQLDDLQMVQELGSGNGGTVHKVLHKTTGTAMALKVIFIYSSYGKVKRLSKTLIRSGHSR